MRTPSSRSTEARTALATESEATVTVTSRVVRRPALRMSTAPMMPPASPIVWASSPKAPGVGGISRRMMSV